MCLPPVIGKFDIRVTITLWRGWLYRPTHAAVCWPFTSPIYVAHLRRTFTLLIYVAHLRCPRRQTAIMHHRMANCDEAAIRDSSGA